jgi:hypothetical protein
MKSSRSGMSALSHTCSGRRPLSPQTPPSPRHVVEVLEQADERVLTRLHRRRAEAEGHHERAVRGSQVDLARHRYVPILQRACRSASIACWRSAPAIHQTRRRIRLTWRATGPCWQARERGDPVPRTASEFPCSHHPTRYCRRLGLRGAVPGGRAGGNQQACPRAARNESAEAARRARGRSVLPFRCDTVHHRPCCESNTQECLAPPVTCSIRHPASPGEVRLSVGDDESEIARAGLIDPWIVDFVDDSVAQREPDPAVAADSGADTSLGAGCPTCWYAWPTGSQRIRNIGHSRLRPVRSK